MTHDLFAFMDKSNQLDLFEKPDRLDIERFFASIKTEEIEKTSDVWHTLACENQSDRFQRWLFAFCSVHTSYKSNMAGYEMIKYWWEWINRPDALQERIDISRMGLTNNRTKFLTLFALDYWRRPNFYEKQENETWVQCRDRLVEQILGLGKAKVSFALEMIYTFEAEVFCADTHLFQAYGKDQQTDLKEYESIERHWIQQSKIWNVPSAIARAILWNRKKNEKDCWYWAKVFANPLGTK